MNKRSFFRDVADAYSLPFRKQGLKAFLFSLLFTVIPVTSFIGEGASYSAAAGRKEGIGAWTKLGLKLILIQLVYAAPAIAAYGLYAILLTYLILGNAIQLILVFIFLLFMTRALLLIPVASCAVALGAPIKVAVNGKEMNSIISGSFGRYILTGIMCLLMLFIADLPAQGDWFIALQYILATVLIVLYRFVKAGLFMGVVRHSLGIEPPPSEHIKGNGSGMAKTVVAAVLCVALIGNSSLNVFAAGLNDNGGFIKYVRPGDDEIQPVEPPGTEDMRNWNNRPVYDNSGKDLPQFFNICGDICNVMPVVSNIKNGIQAVGYYCYGVSTNDEEQKRYYFANAVYKTAAIVTGDLPIKGAKRLKKYDQTMSWLGFSDDIIGTKTDEYFGPATLVLKYYDLVNKAGDVFNRADVKLGEFIDYTNERIAEGTKWWLIEPQPLPGQSHLFIDDPYHPLKTSITDYEYTTREGTLDVSVLDLEDGNGNRLYDYDPDYHDDRPDHSDLPPLDGSYSGQQETPEISSVEGLSYDIIPNKVYIDIYDDNTASFSTVFEAEFDYDLMGYASQSGDAVATIKADDIELIPLDGVESDGYIPMFRGEFTVRATSYMDVTLSGLAYGGETYTMSSEQDGDYTVTFILGYCDGEPMIWDGEITCVPVVESEGEIQMVDSTVKFTCY